MEPHAFLTALAVVLCVAAVTTVLFQWLHQPVVVGYVLAGLIVGPHVPIPLVADQHIVQTLSELGVVLLMFSIGLEFNLGRLAELGPSSGVTAIIQCSVMMVLGFVVAYALGWTVLESVFTGAIVAISSTTIIVKAFDEQRIRGKPRDLVVGVLIVEDIVAIVLMAVLTIVVSENGLSVRAVAHSLGRLVVFLLVLLGVGRLTVPPAIRAVTRLHRPETTLIASIGVCFALSLLALKLGYSAALGAFVAGSLVAESGEERRIDRLVAPVRDMFAAIFFVSVGMLMDPVLIRTHFAAIAVLTAVVIVGKIVSVSIGAYVAGSEPGGAVRAGMSLAQIGELSFVIAGLGLSVGATRSFLYPVAVAVSLITTLTTPWLIRASGPVGGWVDRHWVGRSFGRLRRRRPS